MVNAASDGANDADGGRAVRVQALTAKEEEVDRIQDMLNKPYKWGFSTDVDTETIPAGLNEEVVRMISAKKEEPEWMLDFRLKAFRKWLTMEEPDWSDNRYPQIDYQASSYYLSLIHI